MYFLVWTISGQLSRSHFLAQSQPISSSTTFSSVQYNPIPYHTIPENMSALTMQDGPLHSLGARVVWFHGL